MKRAYQAGLSIVELMIALAVSSFIILGITQVYLDNKKSYNFHQAQAKNQNNGRFSLLVLEEFLGKAGYRRSVHQFVEDAFPDVPSTEDCGTFQEGHTITGLKQTSAEGFCLRYQPAFSDEVDCQGLMLEPDDEQPFAPVTQANTVTLAFKYNPNNQALECRNVKQNAGFKPLVEGVADLKFDFAVGNNDVLNKTVSKVVSAQSTLSNNDMILGVNYSLLLASQGHQRHGNSKTLDEWTGPRVDEIKKNDRQQVYQIVSGSRLIRNAMR